MNRPQRYLYPAPGPGHAVVGVIDALRQHLKQPENSAGYVHRVRVDIKRLRAWLRMIGFQSGDNSWKTLDKNLRSIAKKLSDKRDAQVMVETLKWLQKKSSRKNEKKAIEIIRSHFQFEMGRHPVDWKLIKSLLEAELVVLRLQALAPDAENIFEEGLEETYKHTRKRGKRTFADKKMDDISLHKLRKWVKYLYYQLGYVQAVHPECNINERKYLNDLGDRLGKIHDLSILKEKLGSLANKPDCTGSVERVGKMIDYSLIKLLKRSKELYKRVFTRSASEFVKEFT